MRNKSISSFQSYNLWMMEEFDTFYLCVIFAPIVLGFLLFYLSQNNKQIQRNLYILSWNILFLFLLLSVVFAGGETYYRFFVDRTQGFGGYKLSERWGQRHYTFNNVQIRDNLNYSSQKEPTKNNRVSFVGDSFTEGLGIKNVDDRFANIIRKKYPEWEIHCLARRGRDTHTELRFLEFCKKNRYQFDFVVLCYCLNDIDYLVPEMKLMEEEANKKIQEAGYFERSSYFINTWIHAIMPEQSGYVKNYYTYLQQAYSNAIWKTQTDSLKALSQFVEKQGGQFLAVTFPFLNSPWKDYRFGFVHQEMDSLWKSEGIAHLDLLPLYRRYPAENLVVNSLDAHPNEFADSLAASSISTFLETHLKKNR